MAGPDDYSESDWEPDGTGTYEGNDSTLQYDTDGDQHIIMGEDE